jgi:hypothetical protein
MSDQDLKEKMKKVQKIIDLLNKTTPPPSEKEDEKKPPEKTEATSNFLTKKEKSKRFNKLIDS